MTASSRRTSFSIRRVGEPDFTIDDGVAALIRRRMLSSSGAVSGEALRRSTRADRSRDPVFNRVKFLGALPLARLAACHLVPRPAPLLTTRQVGGALAANRRDGFRPYLEAASSAWGTWTGCVMCSASPGSVEHYVGLTVGSPTTVG